MPDLFARPLGPDGEPAGPMKRLGTLEKILVQPNPYLPDAAATARSWRTREDIIWNLPGLSPARFLNEYTFTIKPGDEARVMSLFHGGPAWVWEVRLAWGRCTAPPISRGTAWRDGTYAACQHQLTGPPEPPRPQFPSWQTAVYPRWYLDWLVWQMRRAYAEHPELFDPRAWTTGDWPTDLAASQLAEQPTRPAIRLYDRRWSYAIDAPGIYAPPRTVTRDYPPPAEPCDECVAATEPDWLRWVQLMITPRAPQPPRTDFMPRYPNGGHR